MRELVCCCSRGSPLLITAAVPVSRLRFTRWQGTTAGCAVLSAGITHILILVGLYVDTQASLHLSLQLLCLHPRSYSQLDSAKQTTGEIFTQVC